MGARLVVCLALLPVGARGAAADPGVGPSPECGLEDPRRAREAPAIPRKPGEAVLAELPPPVRRQRMVATSAVEHPGAGALAGKTVYVSAGHGWTWLPDVGWRTQRPNTHDLVEDFISAESVGYLLARYLRNMGAYVVPVRELDRNPNRVEVDDRDADVLGEVELRPGPAGWGRLSLPIQGDENPFNAGGSTLAEASPGGSGSVIWTFDVPADGEYNVYVAYVQDVSRAPDAHYEVRHAGGESHFRVDQRRHGSTWVWLGRFFFEAGRSPERGAVLLHDDSAEPGATLSADAVRIGGGVGVNDRGGGPSGLPMFETCARYHAQRSGAPPAVYDYADADRQDDVGTRSRFAAWDHPEGEDAVYVAWHTNAPSPGRGTSSFAYGPEPFGTLADFTGVPGSLELMDAVHSEIVGDVRAVWEPGWNDRGQHTAYFGEINPDHNPEMPAVLVEVAFHDTAEDAEALRDPRFRRVAARAMAQGVARYFAERDGADLVLPPGPPTEVRMFGVGEGRLALRWAPPEVDPAGGDPPTGYRVYLSSDGRAFDDGRDVAEPELLLDAPPEEGPVFARVTATNAGGESLPAPVVGARATRGGRARVLLVGGFDRLDGRMLLRQDLSAYDLATIERGLIDRINDGSYLGRYGRAVHARGSSFDAAHADAVASGAVALAGYRAVLWQLGKEEGLSPAERSALSDYIGRGGNAMVSGTEIARALGELGGADEATFLAEVLGALYVADDAGTYAAGGVGPLSGLGRLSFGDRGTGGYDAELPDVLEPSPGSVAAIRYEGGRGGTAGTWLETEAGGRVLLLAFPFEVIEGEESRAEAMARVLGAFGVKPDPPSLGGGCGCRSGAGPGGAGGALLLVLVAWAALARRPRSWKAAASDGDRGDGEHESRPDHLR